jgi:hypothetical protein
MYAPCHSCAPSALWELNVKRKLTNFWEGADCESDVTFPLVDLETTGFMAESEHISESEAP